MIFPACTFAVNSGETVATSATDILRTTAEHDHAFEAASQGVSDGLEEISVRIAKIVSDERDAIYGLRRAEQFARGVRRVALQREL